MNYILGDNIWQEHMKSVRPESVRIIGRVVGRVKLNDISREVDYNQVLDIPAAEAKRSVDLALALLPSNKWVDVIYGQEFLDNSKQYSSIKAAVETQAVQQVQQMDMIDIKNQINQAVSASMTTILDEIKKKAQPTVQTTIDINSIVEQVNAKISQNQEVMNNIVNEIQKKPNGNIVKEIASEIISQMNEKNIIQQKDQQQFKLEEEKISSMVIDVDERPRAENITELGTIKEEKTNLSESLEKMRRLKKQQLSEKTNS